MKNKNDYFVDGINTAINGACYVTRFLTESGSWQRVSHNKGYNALKTLFSTEPLYSTYKNEVWKDVCTKHLRWLQLSITKDNRNYEISFPTTLCAVKELRKLLTANGFICGELI